MQKRYRVGFEEGVKCAILEEYPNLTPLVDTRLFGYGEVVAFCISDWDAQKLADQLNFLEELKRKHLPSSGI